MHAIAAAIISLAFSFLAVSVTDAALSKSSVANDEAWRLNCGATTFDYTDPSGNWWMMDETFTNLSRWGFQAGSPHSVSVDIANTTLDPVYRYSRQGNTNMAYRIELPNGMYQVKLMFSENVWGSSGRRRFNVALEGVTVLSNLDVYSRAGGRYRAFEQSFWPTISDGTLDITFPVIQRDQAMISGIEIKPSSVSDQAILEFIQKKMFRYYWNEANPATGLIKWGEQNFGPGGQQVSSIAVVGMGLSAMTIAAQKGWITPQQARDRIMATLETFDTVTPNVHGFWYHFINMNTAARADASEVSSVDSALLILGALQAGEYFKDTYPEIAQKADTLYRRMDWTWWLNRTRPGIDDPWHNQFVNMGWRPEYDASAPIPNNGPEGGYFVSDWWNRYCESLLVNILALGSPTHPIADGAWKNMARWKVNAFGMDFIQEPPLFTHQYHHLWMDFRGRHDGHADYWQNARLATLANRQTCLTDSLGRYESNRWGLTACEAPAGGYAVYGGSPGGGHDGTVAVSAPMGSMEFAPAEAFAAVRYMFFQYKHHIWGRFGFNDSFNVNQTWRSSWANGLYNGASILALENHLSGLVRDTAMRNVHIRRGLDRAFTPQVQIVAYDNELHRGDWQPVWVRTWGLSRSIQDFEPTNGTPGASFWDAWDSLPALAASPVRSGARSLATQGHTVGIKPRWGNLDLSAATHVGAWVYDTTGSHPVELRLRDTTGANMPVWSAMNTVAGQWTEITWPLSAFVGLDVSSVQDLEFYVTNQGAYYFDDVFHAAESDLQVELKDGGGNVRFANTRDGVVYSDGTYDVWVLTPWDLVVGWNYFYYGFNFPTSAQNSWEARYDDDTTADEPWIPVTW
jgi:hypothetical protein